MKIFIFTDGDLDGVASAAILKLVYKNSEVEFFSRTTPFSERLDKIGRKQFDALFILDLGAPSNKNKEEYQKFKQNILKIINSGRKIYYVDNHPTTKILEHELSGINIKFYTPQDDNTATIVYNLFKPILEDNADVKKIVEIANIQDARRDPETRKIPVKDIDSYVQEIIDTYLIKSEGAKTVVNLPNLRGTSNHELLSKANDVRGEEQKLLREMRSKQKTQGNIVYFSSQCNPFFRDALSNNLREQNKDKISIICLNHNGKSMISTRTYSNNWNLNEVISTAARHAGGVGGGHPKSAGAQIPEKNWEKFLNKVIELTR